MKLVDFLLSSKTQFTIEYRARKFANHFNRKEGWPRYGDGDNLGVKDYWNTFIKNQDNFKALGENSFKYFKGEMGFDQLNDTSKKYLSDRTSFGFDFVLGFLGAALCITAASVYYSLKIIASLLLSPLTIIQAGFKKASEGFLAQLNNLAGVALWGITLVPEFLYKLGSKAVAGLCQLVHKKANDNSFQHDDAASANTSDVTQTQSNEHSFGFDEDNEVAIANSDDKQKDAAADSELADAPDAEAEARALVAANDEPAMVADEVQAATP